MRGLAAAMACAFRMPRAVSTVAAMRVAPRAMPRSASSRARMPVRLRDLVRRLGLGEDDAGQAGPHRRLTVGLDGLAVEAHPDLGAVRCDQRQRFADERPGVGALGGGDGVLQVEDDRVGVAAREAPSMYRRTFTGMARVERRTLLTARPPPARSPGRSAAARRPAGCASAGRARRTRRRRGCGGPRRWSPPGW